MARWPIPQLHSRRSSRVRPTGTSARGAFRLAFCFGVFAQVAQIVVFREMLAACRGTEIFIGVVLAAGLFWTALGSLAMSRARLGGRGAWRVGLGLLAAQGPLLVLEVAFARYRSAAWNGVAERSFLQAALVALAATAPAALAGGAGFVCALRAAGSGGFSRVYPADAWGGALGGALFSFMLVEWVAPIAVGPFLAAVLCLWLRPESGKFRRVSAGLVSCEILVGLGLVWSGLDRRLEERRWHALLPGYRLRTVRDSRYGRIAVLEHPRTRQFSLFQDGGLTAVLSPGKPAPAARDTALFVLAQSRVVPRDVLLVGGGLDRSPHEYRRAGASTVDVVETDPQLLALALDLQGDGAPDPAVRYRCVDGRRWVRAAAAAGRRYDVIVVQPPAPLSASANRFYTRDFFSDLREVLRHSGVVVISIMGSANYPGGTAGRLSAVLYHTLMGVFPEVRAVPGDRHIFVAGKQPGTVSVSPGELGRRLAARGVWLDEFDPDFRTNAELYFTALFEGMIPASQTQGFAAYLRRSRAPTNTDFRPIAYSYALLVWNQIATAAPDSRDPGLNSGANAFFRRLSAFRFQYGLLLPLALLAPVPLLWRLRKKRPHSSVLLRYGVAAAAFATGTFGMATEILLLYAFQNTFGYVYGYLGLLTAAFMAGLALGATAGRRRSSGVRSPAAALGAGMVLCLALPVVLRALHALPPAFDGIGVPAFLLLAFAAGAIDGVTFPLLAAVRRRSEVGRAASSSDSGGAGIYAADLLGAALGALATGAVCVPLLGIEAASFLTALTLGAAWLTVPRGASPS
ncbi:MAG: hypothetical protein GXP31_09670 [Kiritimatiellaeota bacterium]|nr:hypothetical protein [Kiritimatiellota bacterium]